MNTVKRTEELVGLLETQHTLTDGQFGELFDLLEATGSDSAARDVQICEGISEARSTPEEAVLYSAARRAREEYYGKDVYLRGLIEFTNYCRNDCRYCGIRRSNTRAERYRLSKEQILSCCEQGYTLGLKYVISYRRSKIGFPTAR